jgi:hypothetical protein
MSDPVVDEFGHSYERFALQRHLEVNNASPLTNAQYTSYDGILNCFGYIDGPMIVNNYGLKHAITEFWNLCVRSVRDGNVRQTPRNRVPPPYSPRRHRRGTQAPPSTPAPRYPGRIIPRDNSGTTAPPSTPATPVLPGLQFLRIPRHPERITRTNRNVRSVYHSTADDTTDDDLEELIDAGDVTEPVIGYED